MRRFESLDTWRYEEKQVVELGTNRNFTLTQPKVLFNEDYYSVRRSIALENVSVDVIPEPDFYVYEFSYMVTGCCLYVKVIDECSAMKLIENHLKEFLHGNARKAIADFFEGNGKLEEK